MSYTKMSNSLHMVAGSDRCREMQRHRMACTAFFPELALCFPVLAALGIGIQHHMPCFWWHETQNQGVCTQHDAPQLCR